MEGGGGLWVVGSAGVETAGIAAGSHADKSWLSHLISVTQPARVSLTLSLGPSSSMEARPLTVQEAGIAGGGAC